MLTWLSFSLIFGVTFGEDKVYHSCNSRAKILLNSTFEEVTESFSLQSSPSIQLEDLRPGICETTFLIHEGRIFAHERSRSVLMALRGNTIHLRHGEFFFSLIQLLKNTEEILAVKLPSLIFNLETQDNPTCRYPREEVESGKVKAVRGIVHHSFCSPSLCAGTTLLPLSYNQNIVAMEATKNLDMEASKLVWNRRIRKMYWRGSNAGKSKEYAFFKWKNKKMPRAVAVEMCKSRKDADIKFGFVPWKVFTKHKYILSLAGNTYASLFKHALRSGSCILRQEERMHEWFEPFLKEWIHYVPVNWELDNLFGQLEWAKSHDEEARQISIRARVLGESLFTPEMMACYTYSTLIKFHEKLDINFQDDEIVQHFKPINYVCESKRNKRTNCLKIK